MRLVFIVFILFSVLSLSFIGCASTVVQEEASLKSRTIPMNDCDGDGVPNRIDDDDDNDGFSDWLEEEEGTDPCSALDHPELKEE